MQKVLSRKMCEPIPVRLYRDERTALDYLSINNHDLGPCKLVRIGVEFLTHLSRLNGGQIPMLCELNLKKALVRRAQRDARRK
jgi:hypothetical protein